MISGCALGNLTVTLASGVFKGKDGAFSAVLDTYAPVVCKGEMYSSTIRTVKCELLSSSEKCRYCTTYRATLRKLHSRWSERSLSPLNDTSSHANFRYLNTPEKKAKVTELKKRAQAAETENRRLQVKIERLTQQQGDNVDSDFHRDLWGIMKENT